MTSGADLRAGTSFDQLAARELGQQYGVQYAEPFYHVGPAGSVYGFATGEEVQAYIDAHARPLK